MKTNVVVFKSASKARCTEPKAANSVSMLLLPVTAGTLALSGCPATERGREPAKKGAKWSCHDRIRCYIERLCREGGGSGRNEVEKRVETRVGTCESSFRTGGLDERFDCVVSRG